MTKKAITTGMLRILSFHRKICLKNVTIPIFFLTGKIKLKLLIHC